MPRVENRWFIARWEAGYACPCTPQKPASGIHDMYQLQCLEPLTKLTQYLINTSRTR